MPRILILFAHPALEKSRIHRRLAARLPRLAGLTFHDLYEAYPDFDVDVAREQALLLEHDLVVLQHPFFWYSTPPLLKQWTDLVLEHGWAYGASGTALHGKQWLHVLSAGGRLEAYQRGGHNRFTIRELLAPYEQTARLCGMAFLPPYAITGAHRMQEADIDRAASRYDALLRLLAETPMDAASIEPLPLLNDAVDARLDALVRA